MTDNTAITKNWITETGTEGSSSQGSNPLADITLLKVYNPMMGKDPDIELDGQIVRLDPDNGWVPFTKTLKDVKVLEVTKCYKGYANRMVDGKTVTDENGNVLKDLYFTPEVSVYDKSNIAIAKSTEDGPVVLGKGGFKSYLDFTTAMTLSDGTVNPLFNTIGTNSKTGEKYPISIMKQEFSMYFEMEGKLYKLRMGASYGRFKDIKEGTFLHAKDKGMKAFNEIYNTIRFEFHYLTLTGTVEKADKYKYINWEFDRVTENDVTESLTKVREAINGLNENSFKGISINNGLESLPYDMNRLALTTSEQVSDILEAEEVPKAKTNNEEVSLDDLPF